MLIASHCWRRNCILKRSIHNQNVAVIKMYRKVFLTRNKLIHLLQSHLDIKALNPCPTNHLSQRQIDLHLLLIIPTSISGSVFGEEQESH